MLEHELRKAAALRSGRVPVYPPMNARRSGESLRALCELMVELAEEGPLGILRLYLPTDAGPVEVDWVEVRGQPAGSRPQRWVFRAR